MNPTLFPAGGANHGAARGDEIHLLELLDVLLDHRWLIAAVTALAIALGAAYAVLAPPVFRADTLIQVENSSGDPLGGLLGQAASGLFDVRSPASAEMQILRSRLVVEQAVDNLGLDVQVRPRYLPLVGRWLAARASGLSTPGILGWGGFVHGTESLKVGAFEVPVAFEGETFRLQLEEGGAYRLIGPGGDELGRGQVGRELHFSLGGGDAGRLLVTDAQGLPGASFMLTRYFRLELAEALQRQLRLSEEGKQSGVIRASLEGDDPAQVARLLNEIGALYVRQNTERKSAEAERSLDFLGNYLPELRRQVQDSETRYNQFRRRHSTFDLEAEGKAVLDSAVELQTQLLTLEQKRKELRALFTREHPSVRTVDAQIANVRAKLRELDARTHQLPDIEQELLGLTRDMKVNGEMYANLLNSAQQLRLVREGKVANVRVVDPAAVTRKPVKPRGALVLALSAVLGLLAGAALAFVRNSLSAGLREPADIERAGMHVLATVPHSALQARQAQDVTGKLPGNHVLAATAPQEPAVESLRSLRTALQFAMLDATSNLLLVTGPTPGIGKSFTSVNLAAVLSTGGKRVLLIDADMRRGHLNQYFGLARERGLSEVVSGSLTLGQALHRDVVPGLDFLSTGVLPPNPSEVLGASSALELLREAARQYELVLIDTPPVLAVADAALLAVHVGAVFLVARADVTTLGELQETQRRLGDVGVRAGGVIFNGVTSGKRRFANRHRNGSYTYVDYKY